MLTFEELWQRLGHQDEGVEIEAKHGSQVGDSVLETVSAFSNEPHRDGGYIIFGVSLRPDTLFPEYEISGVVNPDRLQSDLASRCGTEFNHPVRPQIWQERRSGRTVVVAYVPEAPPLQKPIFVKKRGQQHGTFRRIGSADVRCTEEDIAYFYQEQTYCTYDETLIREACLEDLDPEMLDEYRRIRAEGNPDAPELGYSGEDLLYALHAASRQDGQLVPTIAGLLVFGRRAAIRRLIPSMRVDYIRVPGREWVPDPENRYQAVEILDPLLRSVPRAISQILDDLPRAFHLPSGQDRRQEVPVIPREAIREVVVNALMHRNYRVRGAVQNIRYSNRLEIRNPGISLIPDDRLGEPGSVTRNEKIAAILHESQYAETKGTGIRAVRELMDRYDLAPPFFESDREKDTFTVTFLFHHLLGPADLAWLDRFREFQLSAEEQKALVFVREVGAINNAAYRDINRTETLIASGHLRRLRDLGLIEQRGQSRATYYLPTVKLLESQPDELPTKPNELEAKSSELKAESSELRDLPAELVAEIQALGGKAAEDRIRRVILQVCTAQPRSADELGRLIGRNPAYLKHRYLHPLLEEGLMAYTIPTEPTHPQQAYRTVGEAKMVARS
jgi:ATP-dependent DNA helicase RecG